MPRLKTYSFWPASMSYPRHVLDALDEPAHRQQATAYACATSKTAAQLYLADGAGMTVPLSAVEIAAGGKEVVALQDAGFLATEGEVLVTPLDGKRPAHAVVRVQGGQSVRIGSLAHGDHWSDPYTFVPEEG